MPKVVSGGEDFLVETIKDLRARAERLERVGTSMNLAGRSVPAGRYHTIFYNFDGGGSDVASWGALGHPVVNSEIVVHNGLVRTPGIDYELIYFERPSPRTIFYVLPPWYSILNANDLIVFRYAY